MRKSAVARLAGAVAATGMAVLPAVVVAPPAAQAAENCTTNRARTVASTSIRSRGIELRANGDAVTCAWGRIFGSPGDRVWVDRSLDGGRTWQQLGVTTINTGGSNFTPAYNDEGKLMRACGHAAGYSYEVACTIWW